MAIIINFNTIIWHIKPSKKGHIIYKNNGKVLVCLVKKNTQVIIISYIYLPAAAQTRLFWLLYTNKALKRAFIIIGYNIINKD